MRQLRLLIVGVAVLVGLIGTVPTVSAGGPPADRVTIIGPVVEDVDCNGALLTRTETGWVNGALGVDSLVTYHLTHAYANARGQVWTYIDTGVIRVYESGGVLYVSLSGHSVNVGPEGTGWIGHFVANQLTGGVWRAGLAVGNIDQLACSLLAAG